MRRTGTRLRPAWLAAAFSIAVLAGCPGIGEPTDAGSDAAPPTDGGMQLPPERCSDFTLPGPGIAFRRATEDYGVDPAGLDVLATRVAVADLDRDGFPDVIAHRGVPYERADFTAPPREWPYRLLMNRARAGGGRELVDMTVESRYGVLRENPPNIGRSAIFAIFADVDDDGDLDALSAAWGERADASRIPLDFPTVLRNDGRGRFALAEFSAAVAGGEFGLPQPMTTAAFLDEDRDGLIDLFLGYGFQSPGVSDWGVPDRLLRGTGDGTFTDVTTMTGVGTFAAPGTRLGARPTGGVTACDVDVDGDTDILVSSGGRQWNQLWLATPDGFVDVGEPSGFDGDDVRGFTADERYRCYCQTSGACTADPPTITCDGVRWVPGTSDHPSMLNGNTMTTVCADLDNDGDVDLYNAERSRWDEGPASDPSQLLMAGAPDDAGVRHYERPGNAATGLALPRTGSAWIEGGIAAAIADLDNDGLSDIVVGAGDAPGRFLWIWRQRPDGTFAETAVAAGVLHPCGGSFALADMDRDGDLDLIAATSEAAACAGDWTAGPPLEIYENTSGQDANWTQIHVEGQGAAGANRSAIGAVVRVRAGGIVRTRNILGGHGHDGLQHDLDVTVGLGETCAIDRIEITWPDRDGTVDSFAPVRANYRLAVRQGQGLRHLR